MTQTSAAVVETEAAPRLRIGAGTALAVIAAYFGLHLVLRTAVSGSVQLDEAEQLLLAQELNWGYSSQPPLYNWLQWAFIHVFGMNVFALALLKNLLLWGIFIFTYVAARRLFKNRQDAILAGAGLLLLPGLVWESQRDQTHLVLATMLAVALVYIGLRTFQTPSITGCVLFGLIAGEGLLSKYNFAIVLGGLIVAGLTLPSWRAGILNFRMLIAVLIFLLVVTPHFYWAWTHRDLALSQSDQFNMKPEIPLIAAWLKGTGQFVKGVLGNVAAIVLVLAALSLRTPFRNGIGRSQPDETGLKLLWRTVWIGLAISLFCILAFAVTKIKSRWFQPLLVIIPMLALAKPSPGLSPSRVRILLGLAIAVMVIVPAVMYGSVLAAGWTKRLTNLNAPYPELSAQIRQAGFTRGVIVAESQIIGGNLKVHFPDSLIVIPEIRPSSLPQNSLVLLAWTGAPHQLNTNVLRLAAISGCTNLSSPVLRIAVAPCKYAPGNQYELGFALLR